MRLAIDNTTRFFTVVGAPYIPEHHFDDCSDDTDHHSLPVAEAEFAAIARNCATNSWLREGG